nr:CCAAT/enhancer-binding protein zeta isoform X2 [Halyomorpha halys]
MAHQKHGKMGKNDFGKDDENEDFGLEEEVPKWFNQFSDEVEIKCEPPDEDDLNSLRQEAENVFEQETKHFMSKQRKGKTGHDSNWLKTMITKGTTKDKIAAHVISIQNAPMFNLSILHGLISMVKASKKHDCSSVMENLSDLFLEDLLIPSKKLKTFDKQPLMKLAEITSGCARARKSRLVAWIFEEKLKECYSQFINAIDIIAKDTVDANRIKAVSVMNKLLTGHPEQEQVLLKNLVNKLGDPNQKVISKVVYSLTQLLQVHPDMKQVVMNEVEKFLFRPNMSTRAQYYSICFLTQFVFQRKDRDVARNIISIYFSFFKAAIKKGEIDSRLMGALLVGVKRAFPFASLAPGSMKEHTDTLYKLVHLSPFNISIHALCLLQEISTDADDRFYSALYKKLLDQDLNKSCHHAIFINLLAKAITRDTNISRVKAIIKRLLQVCLYVPAPLACGFLYLVSYLFSQRRTLLVFQSEPKICTTIKIEDLDDQDDDGDEKYFDADKIEEIKVKEEPDTEENDLVTGKPPDEQTVEEIEPEIKKEADDNKKARGWVYKDLIKSRTSKSSLSYDPQARNPAYSNADKTAYFELVNLSNHFHPSVSLFAKKILTSERIVYSGDPLADFTLVRFLDRFCFKNPKKIFSEDDKNGPDRALANRKYYKPSGVKSVHVLSRDYLLHDKSRIPVDELFLYKYLKDKHGDGKNFVKKEDDDNDSVASEEFEEMLEGMMGGKKIKQLDFMDDIGDKLKKKKGDSDKASELEADSEEDFGEDDDDEDDDDDGEQEDIEGVSDEMGGEEFDFDKDEADALDFSDDGDIDDIDIDEEFFNKKSQEKKGNN